MPWQRYAVVLIVLAGCAAPAPPRPAAHTNDTAPAPIDGATAKELVEAGARLVDVRSPEEYATHHVDSATNVPVDAIAERDLGPKEQPIVVYCASGRRSARAATTLRGRGYTKIYDLGAMSNWDAKK